MATATHREQHDFCRLLTRLLHIQRIPFTFFVKRDWDYFFLVKRDLSFFYLFVIRDSPYLIFA